MQGFTKSYVVKAPNPLTKAAAAAEPPAPAPAALHGLLRDPQTGGRKPAPPVAMPDPLVFYSWWNEEVATPHECTPSGQGMGVRRQVRLNYLPRQEMFQLITDTEHSLMLTIEHADGTPVRVRHPLHPPPAAHTPPAPSIACQW